MSASPRAVAPPRRRPSPALAAAPRGASQPALSLGRLVWALVSCWLALQVLGAGLAAGGAL